MLMNLKSNQYELKTQSPKHCTSAFFYGVLKQQEVPRLASGGIAHRMHTFCQLVVNNFDCLRVL